MPSSMLRMVTSIAMLCAFADAVVTQQLSFTPAFEAASVKSTTSTRLGWSISYTADSLRATNATLAALITSASGIRPDRLVGGPAWVQTTRFDVNAKAAQPRRTRRRTTEKGNRGYCDGPA